jgi:DNA-binding LacI/PurR family transcriptional regulator
MGASAVELLIQRIEGGASLPSRQIVLEAHLVVRQSTAAPRAPSGET